MEDEISYQRYIPGGGKGQFIDRYSFESLVSSLDTEQFRHYVGHLADLYQPENFVRYPYSSTLFTVLPIYCSKNNTIVKEIFENKYPWEHWLETLLRLLPNTDTFIPYLLDLYAPNTDLAIIFNYIQKISHIQQYKAWSSFLKAIISRGRRYGKSYSHPCMQLFKAISDEKNIRSILTKPSDNLCQSAVILEFINKFVDTQPDFDSQEFNYPDGLFEEYKEYSSHLPVDLVFNIICTDQSFNRLCMSLLVPKMTIKSHNMYTKCISLIITILTNLILLNKQLSKELDQIFLHIFTLPFNKNNPPFNDIIKQNAMSFIKIIFQKISSNSCKFTSNLCINSAASTNITNIIHIVNYVFSEKSFWNSLKYSLDDSSFGYHFISIFYKYNLLLNSSLNWSSDINALISNLPKFKSSQIDDCFLYVLRKRKACLDKYKVPYVAKEFKFSISNPKLK